MFQLTDELLERNERIGYGRGLPPPWKGLNASAIGGLYRIIPRPGRGVQPLNPYFKISNLFLLGLSPGFGSNTGTSSIKRSASAIARFSCGSTPRT